MAKQTPETAASADLVAWHASLPDWLQKLPIAETDDDVQLRIAAQILSRDSVDDVLAGLPESVGLRDLVGEVIEITDVRLRPSDIEDAPLQAYALISFKREGDDTEAVCSTGGVNVLAQLVRIHTLNGFPFKCTPYETVSKSNPKNKPLWLRSTDAF